MFEPDSNGLLVLLVVAFAALMGGVIVARHLVVRVLAALLAFVPAALFGVACVNKYYGYYETWGAVAADFSGSGTASNLPAMPSIPPGSATGSQPVPVPSGEAPPGRRPSLSPAAADGITVRMQVPGRLSGISRQVLVFLPGQYFQPGYARHRFPVIELLHGSPGQPQDWITVLGVTATLERLIATGQAAPAVLVMPDINGQSHRWSEQCLNQAGGPQDATYLAQDVPAYLAARLNILPPGPAWGVAGYSEGGFCAANLALNYPGSYGYAGVMSGYFAPGSNIIDGRPVDPFRGSTPLRLQNDPMWLLSHWRGPAPVPGFWLSAAHDDVPDYLALVRFARLARQRLASVPVYVPGYGKHTAVAWREALPRLLQWMTPLLAAAPVCPPAPPAASPSPGQQQPAGGLPARGVSPVAGPVAGSAHQVLPTSPATGVLNGSASPSPSARCG